MTIPAGRTCVKRNQLFSKYGIFTRKNILKMKNYFVFKQPQNIDKV